MCVCAILLFHARMYTGKKNQQSKLMANGFLTHQDVSTIHHSPLPQVGTFCDTSAHLFIHSFHGFAHIWLLFCKQVFIELSLRRSSANVALNKHKTPSKKKKKSLLSFLNAFSILERLVNVFYSTTICSFSPVDLYFLLYYTLLFLQVQQPELVKCSPPPPLQSCSQIRLQHDLPFL